ncbi:MAG: hypothetical protein LBE51_09935 [Acidovorax sp.]|jgi:uncharacterized protein|nr:hypothetical protein [Acidovorax sp.]MDR3005783.1 hypothetical protein [Acidovorax sp.]
MKYLLVIAVVVIFYLYLKKQRAPLRPPPKTGTSLAPPQSMQACAHCGLHLPAQDALRDAAGRPYCSEAHRLSGPSHGG